MRRSTPPSAFAPSSIFTIDGSTPRACMQCPRKRTGNSENEPQSMATTLNDAPPVTLTEFDRGYYGWRVVLASCLGVMVGFGSLFVDTFSIFMKPLGAEFGWGREAISRGFGLAALSMAFCSPILGHLLDRYGPRR